MNEYNALKDAIRAAIKPNGEYALTAQVLQNILIAIVDSFGKGYQFMGIATADTEPGEPDEKEFYVGFAGEYANFGSETVTVPVGGVVIFLYDTSWHANVVKVAERVAVSDNHLEIDGVRSIIEQDIVNVNTLTSQGEAFLTAAAARAAVTAESGLRIGGQVITYLVETDEEHHTAWVVDQFTGDDAEGWENDDNWQPFLYVELAKIVSNQAQINEAIMEALGNRYTKEQVDGMIQPLSERMGAAEEGLAAEILRAQAAESRLQDIYEGLTQNPVVVGPLPSSGQADTIYRVPGTSSYSDYMWNGTQFVLMATYSDGRLDFINVNLLNATGSTPHAAYATADAARADISAASGLRALGLQITYLLTDGVWYTDQYIGTDISGWSTASNWKTLGPVSVSQNTITLEEWQPNTDYVVGNQRQTGTPTKYYRCTTAHTSGSTFDETEQANWAQIGDFVQGGTSLLNISVGSDNHPICQTNIKLTGFGPGDVDIAPNIGDVFYQTTTHCLRIRVSVGQPLTNFATLPFYDGAIYNCDGKLYIWNGSDLVEVGKDDIDSLQSQIIDNKERINAIYLDINKLSLWELGSIQDGNDVAVNNRVRTHGYIEIAKQDIDNEVLHIYSTDRIQYIVNYYTSSNAWLGNSGSYSTGSSDFTIPANTQKIRFLLKLDGSNEYLSPVPVWILSSIWTWQDSLLNEQLYKQIHPSLYEDLLTGATWENKNIAGQTTNVRLRTKITIPAGKLRFLSNSNYRLRVYEKEDANTEITKESTYNFVLDNYFERSVFIILQNSDGDTNINESAKKNIGLYKIADLSSNRNDIVQKTFRVSSYNVREYFSMESEQSVITDWITQFKEFMNGLLNSSPIMFTQEESGTYKDEEGNTSNSYNLYKQFYPYRYIASPNGHCGIYSYYPLYNTQPILITVGAGTPNEYTRVHTFGMINLLGKEVALVSIHGGIKSEELLEEEFAALYNFLADYDYVIIGGDTNDVQDFAAVNAVFVENGYITANFGYWGGKVTWESFDGQDSKKIDSFIVKGFTINSFEIKDHELGDHKPIMSELRMLL